LQIIGPWIKLGLKFRVTALWLQIDQSNMLRFKGKTINWYENQYLKNNKQQNGFKDTIN